MTILPVSGVLRHSLPLPAFGRGWVCYGKPPIALDPRGDQKSPLPCRSPETFGTVPAIEQDMRHYSRDWLKRADHGFHRLNLAGKRHAFHSADLCCRYSWGARGQRRPNSKDRLSTRLWPVTRLSCVVE